MPLSLRRVLRTPSPRDVRIVAVIVSVVIWGIFAQPGPHLHTWNFYDYIFLGIILVLVLGIVTFVAMTVRELNSAVLLPMLWLLVNAIVLGFASTYANMGTTRDFSASLTKVDALYVALGTLSTAGSGNLYAVSDRARVAQMGQFVADLILVLFIVGVMVSRLVASRSKQDEWIEVDIPEEGEWV